MENYPCYCYLSGALTSPQPKHWPYIINLSLSWYDWNTVEKDVKSQVIHPSQALNTFYLHVVFKKWEASVEKVEHWPADLVKLGLSPAGAGSLLNVNRVPLHTAFDFHPPVVLIWPTYCWKGRKITSHPSILNQWLDFYQTCMDKSVG